MRTYKLTIAYDGSKYQGWQKQGNTSLTIQGMLESVVEKVVGYYVPVNGSGRTDRGVHAKGQTASIVLAGMIDTHEFMCNINEQLPSDIQILQVDLVKNGFHARLGAKGKCYEYWLDLREKPEVFTRKYTYHFPKKLQISEMKKAVSFLVGEHDFKAFTDKKDEKSTIRCIYDIKIEEYGSKIKIEYKGNGFMYHMIRIITGTLLEVGDGRRKPEEVCTILESKKRGNAGFLVPARGLFLKEVYYE